MILKQSMKRYYNKVKKLSLKRKLNHTFKNFNSSPKVYYFGVTLHQNLGDLAQYYCIREWIRENYTSWQLIEIESDTVVLQKNEFLELAKPKITNRDIFICQSGYTTQDLGGNHNEMHMFLVENFPLNKILIMPQTVFFKNESNRYKTINAYRGASNVIFLARDEVSFFQAKEMFSDSSVALYPDIVTTLIGKYSFSFERKGILLCLRNDSEKFYNNTEIKDLINNLECIDKVSVTDTNAHIQGFRLKALSINHTIRREMPRLLEEQLKAFAHYKVVVTDRYHGTIFSLISGTPVVVIKTTDHKVTSGVDWFQNECRENVYSASSLDDAEKKVRIIYKNEDSSNIIEQSSFDDYYNGLSELIRAL